MVTRVGLTGATGFIGSHLLTELLTIPNLQVITIGRRPSRANVKHTFWDGTFTPHVEEKCDIVIHCAAVMRTGTSQHDFHMSTFNIESVKQLKLLAREQYIHISSASVYSPLLNRENINENHPTGNVLSAYSWSKSEAEKHAESDMTTILRPHAVYGTGDNHLLPRLKKATLPGGLLPLPGKDIKVSLTNVRNLTHATLHSMGVRQYQLGIGTPWVAGVYNIADKTPYMRDETLKLFLPDVKIVHPPIRFVEKLARAWHTSDKLTPYTVDQICHTITLNINKATQQRWEPPHNIAQFFNHT